MSAILLIFLILLAVGAFGGGRAGWYPVEYGYGGGVGLIIIVLAILLLAGSI